MPLFQYNATADSEPTLVFVSATNMQEAAHALADSDLGDVDWESIQPYIDGDKRPRAIKTLESIPDDYHDAVYLGENDAEETVTEFFDE
ncbi:MAG: hypothetical protein EOP83_11595 [Verrucomicrobiaceae bacterium]|nr:MAG: hypothetical protein EOP83_11595 [Verrucomicrobiaceae bacterium]